MRIALIDHPYHKVTGSTVFIRKLLESIGSVDFYWEDRWWAGNGIMDLEPILTGDYDLVVCLQTEFLAPVILQSISNVIIIPMFDGASLWSESFWKQCMRARIISFSRAMHELLLAYSCDSYYFQYAPDPSNFEQVECFDSMRAFFWERLPNGSVNSNSVLSMLAETEVTSLHIHQVPDDGVISPLLPHSQIEVSTSTWFSSSDEFQEVLGAANIFIQPRPKEGIGMAFLEAMAMGQYVVSPDESTMNEYITDGVTGTLFDVEDPEGAQLVSFEEARRIGRAARRYIGEVHQTWMIDQTRLLKLFKSKRGNPALRERFGYDETFNFIRRTSDQERKTDTPPQSGRITVVTVVKNSRDDLNKTIQSVNLIKYSDLEYIILDGQSSDGTIEAIKSEANSIDFWLSEPDLGPFDAMNKASRYATGEYILFMNAGDTFCDANVLNLVMEIASTSGFAPDFIFGHHFWKRTNGALEFRKANLFSYTWEQLQNERIDVNWLSGIPCHQSTLTRTDHLRGNPFNLSYHIAADHELLFRSKKIGATFLHAGCAVSIYNEGGISSQGIDRLNVEWYNIFKNFSPRNLSVDAMFSTATGYKAFDFISKDITLSQQIKSEAIAKPGDNSLKEKVVEILQPYPVVFRMCHRIYRFFIYR